MGTAALDREGYLLGYEDVQGMELPQPVSRTAAVEAVAQSPAGKAQVHDVRYVYAPGTLESGASPFAPFAKVRRSDGEYLVNTTGEVFRDAGRYALPEKGPTSRAEGALLLQHGGLREFSRIQ